jgi:outer membrane receptor protein involved in Fe transport
MTLSVWDAQVTAQTFATNLDLKGKFQVGPFTNAVLLGPRHKGQGPNGYAMDDGIFISRCSDNPYFVSENGNRLQDVPLNAAALWLQYSASSLWSGLSVGGGVVAVGERAGDNQNDYAPPGYACIDGMIQCRWIPQADTGMKAVTFQLYVKNLANAVYFQNSSSRLDAFPGAPRTFLVSLGRVLRSRIIKLWKIDLGISASMTALPTWTIRPVIFKSTECRINLSSPLRAATAGP